MQNTVKRISILVAALLPVVVLGFVVLSPKAQSSTASTSSVVVTQPVSASATGISAAKPTATPSSSNASAPGVATTTAEATAPASTTTSANPTSPTPTSTYKDGTYSVTTTYRVPEAPAQSMGVELTLVNDVVTAATVTAKATDGTSMMYQNAFIAGYKTFVVGKNIADVQLGKVSGSSLTPKGFNDAVSAIKTQAAA